MSLGTGSIIFLLAWAAVVTTIVLVVARPWKAPAARAPLPLSLAGLVGLWVLVMGALSHAELMSLGSWTAASVTIGLIPIKASFMALLAYAAGRSINTARAASGPVVQRWGLAAALSAGSVYLVAADIQASIDNARATHARSTALSPEEVQALTAKVRDGKAVPDEMSAFLGNPLCPPDLLARYAASEDPRWRRAVARNGTLIPELAEKLATDTDEEVRYMLSFNRDLTPALLSRLAADSSVNVRAMVAWTKTLPDEDFAKLVEDPSAEVRATAAIQPRLSPEALEKLRADPEERVRNAANRRQ